MKKSTMIPPSKKVPLNTLSDEGVAQLLQKNRIGLSTSDARMVCETLGREPTITELYLWGVLGSEHCAYRSTRAHLKRLPTAAPNVILGVGQDSGIVEIAKDGDKRYGLVISHESHNHPSQVVPYEGAATGVGGVVRDVACMGARVIGCLDALRFGDIQSHHARLIAEEVVKGVGGYGNALGVPNLGGDTYFDAAFNENCLVNVIAIGVLEAREIIHSKAPPDAEGYDIVLVGKPTDRSGLGGAAFSSFVLDEARDAENRAAVQEPNPFLGHHLLVSSFSLFQRLKKMNALGKVAFKDLGAGGIACATLELTESGGFGAIVDLDRVPLDIADLDATTISCAETQERYCWLCHPDLTPVILEEYNEVWSLPEVARNARAQVIGRVVRGNYQLHYRGECFADVPVGAIRDSIQCDRPYAAPTPEARPETPIPEPTDFRDFAMRLLADESCCSRAPIYETYDKMVLGMTAIEPGIADAGVIVPLVDREDASPAVRNTGAVIGVGGNPRYGMLDPFLQAANAVAESVRNVLAVGAVPQALSNCLNYGSPERPDQMWQVVRGIDGLAEAATQITLRDHPGNPLPIVTGNVSLYNESNGKAIPPTAIVSCIGTLPDYRKALTAGWKRAGSTIYLAGRIKDELGGSAYCRAWNLLGNSAPVPDYDELRRLVAFLPRCADEQWALAAHDVSDGGLFLALCEMTILADESLSLGAEVTVPKLENLSPIRTLFAESGTFVLEVRRESEQPFVAAAHEHGLTITKLGTVTQTGALSISDLVTLTAREMAEVWRNSLRRRFD